MPNYLVGATLAGLGTSLVGYHANKKLAEYQNELNVEQWNRENEYNSPKNQMARFAEAGLNPNLLVGQQNLSAQSPQMVGGLAPDFTPFSDSVRSGALLDSQIELNQAKAQQARGEDALSQSTISLNISKEELNKLYGAETAEKILNLKETRNNIIALTDKYKAEANLTDLKSVEQFVNNMYANEKAQAEISKLQAECSKFNADAKEVLTLLLAKLYNIQADTDLKHRQSKESLMMAGVLANAFQVGKVEVDFIKEHPELKNFGQTMDEIIPTINSIGDFLGNILPFGMPTKRAVSVARP